MAEAFNPLEAAKKLQEAGCEQKLAKEMASQINGAISGTVATKGDIKRLEASTKADLERVGASTKVEIERLGVSTKTDFEQLRKDVELNFAEMKTVSADSKADLKSEMLSQLRWIGGIVVATGCLLFAPLKFWG